MTEWIFSDEPTRGRPHRVLMSGSSGFLGQALTARLRVAGHVVVPLVRGGNAGEGIRWEPGSGSLRPEEVSGFDAVVHLAGEPVMGLWSAGKKRRIFESRVRGTAELAAALAAAPQPPRVLLCASGINFYGNGGKRILDEGAPQGEGFLAEVCEAWEAASMPVAAVARVVTLRIGVVLDARGGALAKMLPLFRRGLGAVIGDGEGYVSWISLRDLLRGMEYAIQRDTLRGAVNLVSPEPVTAAVFNRTVAAAVGRRLRLRLPAWPVRLVLGPLAEETILGSVRAVPRRLLEDGFGFEDATLAGALRALRLGEESPGSSSRGGAGL